MYTRCTNCHSVLPLAPADLAQAGGIVRCGGCGRTLNALSELFAYPPEADSKPIDSDGMPPLLTPRVEQDQIFESEDELSEDRLAVFGADRAARDDMNAGPILDFSKPERATPPWLRWLWPLLAGVMLFVLALQLLGPQNWRVNWSVLDSSPQQLIDLDEAVQVISRDLHPHPSLNDAVIVSAVLINRSEQTVRWPEVEVRLFDASQQVIGERRLQPDEYLDAQTDASAGFDAQARQPIVLELVTEASIATGFSLAFY